MDRKDGKNLHKLDLAGLAELCISVAINRSASETQTDTAHALRREWVGLGLGRALGDGKKEAEASLRERMLEFLAGIPAWMTSGV